MSLGMSGDMKVMKAELLFSNFLVEHNLPLSVADHATPLFKAMFPDSATAEKFSCRRTKATSLVHYLSCSAQEKINSALKSQPFALATDGSNDRHSPTSLYPIVVRYYDMNCGRIVCVVLSIPGNTEASTGQNIFNLLNAELVLRNIPWKNCIAFECDSASVMVGRYKGVAAFIKKEHPSVYVQGCVCHLIHLAAEKAVAELPVSVEDLLIDLYYYFDKSTKRLQELRKFQLLCDVETHKILKHVSTRWLSLGLCIKRLLEQYVPLLQYFQSLSPKSSASGTKSSSTQDCGPPEKMRKTEQSTGKSSSSTSSTKASAQASTSSQSRGTKSSSAQSSISKSTTGKSSSSTKASAQASTSSQSRGIKSSSAQSSISKSTMSTGKSSSSVSTKASAQASTSSQASTSQASTSASKSSTEMSCANTRILRIKKALSDPNTKLYCLFLDNIIPVFDKINVLLQRDEPCIHIMLDSLTELLTNLYIRFVTPSAVTEAESILTVDFANRKNQKERHDLVIGSTTKQYISEQKEAGSLSGSDLRVFYQSVRSYLTAACTYIMSKFPLDDPLLRHAASFLNIENRKVAKFESVEYFIERFPCLLQNQNHESTVISKDVLELEFLKFQIDMKIPESIVKAERVDLAWHMISQLKDNTTGQYMYPGLSKVALGVLVLPHSNADSERVFSIVRKNRTEFRPNLSDAGLEGLIVQKVSASASGIKCFEHEYSHEYLRRAKSATTRSQGRSDTTDASDVSGTVNSQ
jgi:hypothetical protein